MAGIKEIFDAHPPLHQFEIHRLVPICLGGKWDEASEACFGGIDISFTNASLFMVVAVSIISIFLIAAMGKRSLIPNRLQSIAEMAYEFVANMLRENVGSTGMRYFPFIFTLFMFILALNMIGMVPYTFTVTSHVIVTFSLAIVIFLGVTTIGFARHGLGYLRIFVPPGVPLWLLPLLVVIEIISYFIRPFTLAVRLFANMLAGHTMLKVFGGFVIGLSWLGIVPLLLIVALTGLEFLVGFLQAYVFAILTCIYLNDALNMEH